jgi:hypothetical protein
MDLSSFELGTVHSKFKGIQNQNLLSQNTKIELPTV